MKVFPFEKGLAKAWVDSVPEIEPQAMDQIRNVAAMPFIFRHVAVMPDVHAGMGATVGSVIPTRGAVMPSAVGVDIGCGMVAARLPDDFFLMKHNLADVRKDIENAVPNGRSNDGRPGDVGAWSDNVPKNVEEIWRRYLEAGYNDIIDRNHACKPQGQYPMMHLGTLGTGNHFIELCEGSDRRTWVVIHSGSRGIGNRIGSTFTRIAQQECDKWYVSLPDRNLAFLPEGTDEFINYVRAVSWAQKYAKLNRSLMLDAVVGVLGSRIDGEPIDCHHNYLAHEKHFGETVIVTRKGAVSARKGELGIIPGSMGARSYIVEGLGNRDSFNSCSHGAGRVMSRTQARKSFSVIQHQAVTAGVECDKTAETLDETPGAYKDIDAVMASQADLVRPIHTLKQFLCVKGKGDK